MKATLVVIILSGVTLVGCTPQESVDDQVQELQQVISSTEDSRETPALITDDKQGASPGMSQAMLAGSNAIFVNPQLPGEKIEINTVQLQKPGYVVIYTIQDGQPGEVIGHSKLLDTDVVTTTVELAVTVQDGEELIAMLHIDDGNGVYEFPGPDGPIFEESTGDPVMMSFTISETADQKPQMMP